MLTHIHVKSPSLGRSSLFSKFQWEFECWWTKLMFRNGFAQNLPSLARCKEGDIPLLNISNLTWMDSRGCWSSGTMTYPKVQGTAWMGRNTRCRLTFHCEVSSHYNYQQMIFTSLTFVYRNVFLFAPPSYRRGQWPFNWLIYKELLIWYQLIIIIITSTLCAIVLSNLHPWN